jgi:hypothetical protein
VPRAIDEGDVSEELHLGLAGGAFCGILLAGSVGPKAVGSGALDALVELGVSVPKLDGDVSDLFFEMLNCVHSGDSPDEGRLSMGHMTDGSDVNRGLSGDDLWRQRGQGVDVQVGQVLNGEVVLGLDLFEVFSDDLLFGEGDVGVFAFFYHSVVFITIY